MTPGAAHIFAVIALILNNFGECTPLTPCPKAFESCECRIPTVGLISVDCSRRGLALFPVELDGLEKTVFHLDLSHNYLVEYPSALGAFTALETLDLSNNEIASIAETASLPPNLRNLYLANNNITNWVDINPSKLLVTAAYLHTLSLAGNSLHSLTSNDERLLLISGSLKLLDLSECSISRVSGRLTISGLLSLEHLLLNGNPLHTIPQLKADQLLSLDLSACEISHLHPDVFAAMPVLTYVNLSRNSRLSLRAKTEFVQSATLRRIDLTQCNMNAVELVGFPNLTTAILKGNLISELTWESFEFNDNLENIDLSFNSITHITSTTFRRMAHLKNIDFSFNMIRKVEADTFRENNYLTSINLSRNYIDRFRRIAALSLTYLNVSWCEILNIDLDAFNDMPELIELDLSHNLIREFPATLHSRTLQILDLSNCRLMTINNRTFAGLPELSRLNLASNRFTTTFRTEFFAKNPYLNDIWLGDNPWRCECWGYGLQDFYQFLTVPPARTNDRGQLRCASPDELQNKHWNVACREAWYPTKRQMGKVEKIWTITMVILIIGSMNFCIFLSFKKWLRGRAERRHEQDRLQVIEDTHELMRINRRVLDQEAQLNAPDPRETHPPCYEEAILLPRLDSSFASLKQLAGECDADERRKAAKRSRSRSEEFISRSSNDDGASRPKRHILAARLRLTKPKAADTMAIAPLLLPSTSSAAPRASSTEIITLNRSPRMHRLHAPDAGSRTLHASSTFEFAIEPLERYVNFAGRSPYAPRRNVGGSNQHSPSSSADLRDREPSYCEIDAPEDIVIIENHFRSKDSLDLVDVKRKISCSSSESSQSNGKSSERNEKRESFTSSSSEDYTKFTKDEIQNVRRSQI